MWGVNEQSATYKRTKWQEVCVYSTQACGLQPGAEFSLNFRLSHRLLAVTAVVVMASWASAAVPARLAVRIRSTALLQVENVQWKQLARFTPVKNGGRSCAAF